MQTISTQKFVRMSPRKLRLVADAVRGREVLDSLEILPFLEKRAALPVGKVIKTATADAKVKGASPAELVISSIEISEAPRLKRFRPVSRGQAHSYVRAMSHIRVVLQTVEKKAEAEPKVSKPKTKKEKK